MKYFTPALYVRFNSSDDAEADRADAEWENAIRHYNQYLKEHRSKMPANVRVLAEKCCFHDALFLGVETHQFGPKRKMATLSLQQDDQIIVLFYFLWDSLHRHKPSKNWPFAKEPVHWLYDEVDVLDQLAATFPAYGYFHRILLSDGSQLIVPFVDVVVRRVEARRPALAGMAE